MLAVKIFFCNLLILFLGLIGLEFYFGGWFDTEALDRMGLPREQHLEISVKGLYPSTKDKIKYTRDSHGLRGDFNAPRSVDLLTVGGSTTNQLFIDDGDTWQAVFESEFEKNGRKIVVANAGVDGQSSYGHLYNFKNWFPKIPGLKPRIILFYMGLNDYFFTIDDDQALPEFSETAADRGNWLDRLKKKSVLWYLGKKLFGIYKVEQLSFAHRPVKFSKLKWVNRGRIADYQLITAEAARGYAKRIRKLIELARQMQATPVFVTQPSRHYRFLNGELQGVAHNFPFNERKANGVDFFNIMRAYDQALLEICAEQRVTCFDLDKKIWDDADFYDYLHMTPVGTKKLGLELARLMHDFI